MQALGARLAAAGGAGARASRARRRRRRAWRGDTAASMDPRRGGGHLVRGGAGVSKPARALWVQTPTTTCCRPSRSPRRRQRGAVTPGCWCSVMRGRRSTRRAVSCRVSSIRGLLVVVNDSRVVPARLRVLHRRASWSCWCATRGRGSSPGEYVPRVGPRGQAAAARRRRDLRRVVRSLRRARRDRSAGAGVFAVEAGEWMGALQSRGEGPAAAVHPAARGAYRRRRERAIRTIYAAQPGSVAAPTAGLHWEPEVLAQLDVVRVTRTSGRARSCRSRGRGRARAQGRRRAHRGRRGGGRPDRRGQGGGASGRGDRDHGHARARGGGARRRRDRGAVLRRHRPGDRAGLRVPGGRRDRHQLPPARAARC